MRIARVWVLAGLVVTGCGMGMGQGVPAPAAGAVTFQVKVSAGKSATPVLDLQQSDFSVLDNKTTVPVTTVQAMGAEPVETILVVDAVNDSFTNVSYARQEIEKFLKKQEGPLAEPVALALLTDKGLEVQGAGTRDAKQLVASLDANETGLRIIRRSEGFYGAEERQQISLGALEGLLAKEKARPGRKAILWVSPGWPLLSGPQVELTGKQQNAIFARVEALSAEMRAAGVTLYNINPIGSAEGELRANLYLDYLKAPRKPGQVDLGDLSLQVLAVQSGGLVLELNNDVAGMLATCVADLRGWYAVSFRAATEGGYHAVEVRVGRPGLTVRTRNGYYAGR